MGALCGDVLVIPERRPILEFLEEVLVIPEGKSATPGPFTPHVYQREMLEAMDTDGVEEVVVCLFSQGGKSLLQMGALAHWTMNDPGDAMVVYPQDLTRVDMVEDKLESMIDASPGWGRELVAGKRSITQKKMRCLRSTVYFAIASSEPQLASRTVKYVLTDEEDKFPVSTRHEGAPTDQAKKRQRTWKGRSPKRVRVSTPTHPRGPIWRALRQSDWRVWEVPCLACGEFDRWRMERIVFPERGVRGGQHTTEARSHGEGKERESLGDWATRIENGEGEVGYRCGACGAVALGEREQRRMNARGRWRPTQPQYRRRVGFQGPSLMGATSWRDWAVEFLRAKEAERFGNLEPMKVFRNHEEAEPFVPPAHVVEEEAVAARAVDVAPGWVPEGFECVTVGADLQGDRLVWVALAWKAEPLCGHVLDFGVIEGRPAVSLAKFGTEVVGRVWRGREWEGLARAVGVDAGWGMYAVDVYRFALEAGRHVFPVKGESRPLGGGAVVKRSVAAGKGRERSEHGGRLILVCPRAANDRLARLMEEDPLREEEVLGSRGGLSFCRRVLEDGQFQREWVSEERNDRGDWVLREGFLANHFRDAGRYGLAMAALVGVFKGQMRKVRWVVRK